MGVRATCVGCGEHFEAIRSTAKWCSDRCRKAAARRAAATPVEVAVPDVEQLGEGLVKSVLAELEAAGRLDSFHGQLAVQLARQVTSAGATGIAGLSKELRTVMDAALGTVAPDDGEPAPVEEAEDEVTRARREREEARQAAGLA